MVGFFLLHQMSKQPLPFEPMNYKELIKDPVQELMTKLKIIRSVLKSKNGRIAVAKSFSAHRNTIGEILSSFKKKLSPDVQKKLLEDSMTQSEILELMSPLKNQSRQPHTHPKTASVEQEEAVLMLFHEKGIRVGRKRFYQILKRQLAGLESGKDPPAGWEKLVCLKPLTNSQLKGIYKRKGLKVKKVKTTNR